MGFVGTPDLRLVARSPATCDQLGRWGSWRRCLWLKHGAEQETIPRSSQGSRGIKKSHLPMMVSPPDDDVTLQ
ncbi:hypothetical protein Y1Q_0009042 [Alligator mississippiensis]|uniref:Uncharacterized protein n=1 Tax=Alligator mississippiensis TaxID=8496 RepID=A0A151P4X8_ALLMI|nr:hypothetical protein Y1Q_0009042 [Alligator mississippiensis]